MSLNFTPIKIHIVQPPKDENRDIIDSLEVLSYVNDTGVFLRQSDRQLRRPRPLSRPSTKVIVTDIM